MLLHEGGKALGKGNKCFCAVADLVLFIKRELGKGEWIARGTKKRIVAETAVSLQGFEHFTRAFAAYS